MKYPLSDRIHMMTPNLTALCRSFRLRGTLLKTDRRDQVTCPKCMDLMARSDKRAARS